MTVWMKKGLALCGLCAVLASAGNAATAQGYHHGPMHHGPMRHARHAILRQKAAYAHAVANGHYKAAERAHLRASAIRHHVRAHQGMKHTGHAY